METVGDDEREPRHEPETIRLTGSRSDPLHAEVEFPADPGAPTAPWWAFALGGAILAAGVVLLFIFRAVGAMLVLVGALIAASGLSRTFSVRPVRTRPTAGAVSRSTRR